MAAYFIAHGTLKDATKMERYVAISGPVMARHGGEWITTGEVKAVLTGAHKHQRTAIFKFPSIEYLQAWYNDPEYKVLWEFRKECGDFDFLAIEEFPWVEDAKKLKHRE
jgi:uncharacterized protein (DUF1330 family)